MLPLLLLLASLSQDPRVAWVPNPRAASGGWVADVGHHLQPATLDSLNRLITRLERETSAELAIVVVDSTAGLEPFDFALQLHRSWGVGKAGIDNGVLFLWVPAQRKVFISVGYGLEGVLPDIRVGRIRDTELFPSFRRGEFDRGVLETASALARAIREEPVPSRTVTAKIRRAYRREPGKYWGGGALELVLALALGIPVVRTYRRRRPRRCPQCGQMMRRLTESEDDQKLMPGEIKEENLRSVDYDVWLCDNCGSWLRLRYPHWFSKYRRCPQCGHKTLVETVETLVKATTQHGGRERVHERCEFCRYRMERERTTPRLSSSSGGGSGGGGGGGGGGFGGGSAGGGGAGGGY